MGHDAAPALGDHSPQLFLSYAAADRGRALAIADSLDAAGVPVWIDRRGIVGGDLWAAVITNAIRSSAAVAVLCTPASGASRNVRQELQLAWDHDRPILPVMLEPVEFSDAMAYFLQGRQWIDATSQTDSAWLAELTAAVARLGVHPVAPPAPTPAAHQIDLPVPPGPLIGRDQEVDAILDHFQGGTRLITLTGPGGVGKTRLALEAVRRTAESLVSDAIFIDLAPVDDHALVPSAIARSLGVRDAGGRSLREAMRLATRDRRRRLLLLDNFEQVIEAAPLIGELLADAPELRVVVTSREALRLRGEHELVIDPLDLPTEREMADLDCLARSASVALFVATARTAKAGFGLSPENARAIAGICRRLDGLPLAIELAATRVKHHSPAQLLDQLERRLPVLTGGPRDLPARQQTLRATIAWSYALLSADEQALLRRLSVFAGGAPSSAIEPVASAASHLAIDLSEGLASLVDKSLLKEETGDGDHLRYAMLETIREFALDQLSEAGDGMQVQSAHAAWALHLLDPWSIDDPETFLSLTGLQVLDDEFENIRSAFDQLSMQGDAEACARVFIELFTFWYTRGRVREAQSMGRQVLELAELEPIPDRLRGVLLGHLAIATTMLGDPVEGELLGREGLSLLRHSPTNVDLLPTALLQLAIPIREQGRYADAMTLAERAHGIATESGQQALVALTLHHIGKVAYLQDDLDRALTCLTDALHQTRLAPANETAVLSAVYLAHVHARRGAFGEAARALSDGTLMVTDFGSGFERLPLEIVAVVAASKRPVDAVRLFGAETAYADQIGTNLEDEPLVADAKLALRQQLGETEYQAALQSGRKLGPDDTLALVREILGELETTL